MCETTLYCIAFKIILLTELRQSIKGEGPFHSKFLSERPRLPLACLEMIFIILESFLLA